MFESMYAAKGVGLAAPQIGIRKRIAVIDVTSNGDPKDKLVLINPEIIHTEGKQGEEGCLSIPGFREQVNARQQSHRPGPGRQGKVVREDRRRPAGPRLPARDRPPERQALHHPHQRSQARSDEAQDPKLMKAGEW